MEKVVKDRALEAMRSAVAEEKASSECSFWWVRAEWLVAWEQQQRLERKRTGSSKPVSLPAFQELQLMNKALGETQPILMKKRMTWVNTIDGKYKDRYLAVSHRWMAPDQPDEDGTQFHAVCEFLASRPGIKWVWFECVAGPTATSPNPVDNHLLTAWCRFHSYWCMPQGVRTPSESAAFRHMLSHVNFVYLGCSVLSLVDLSYVSRFWTQFEAWLSMQDATEHGLRPAARDSRRCTMVPIQGADHKICESLVDMWSDRDPRQAYDHLAKPDISVTNQRDKVEQLAKLLELNEIVQMAMVAPRLLHSTLSEAGMFGLHGEPQDPQHRSVAVNGIHPHTGTEPRLLSSDSFTTMQDDSFATALESSFATASATDSGPATFRVSVLQRAQDAETPPGDQEQDQTVDQPSVGILARLETCLAPPRRARAHACASDVPVHACASVPVSGI